MTQGKSALQQACWIARGGAHRAKGVVDAAQAVICFEQQQKRAWHAPQEVTDFDGEPLRDVSGRVALSLGMLQPQMIRRRVSNLQ